MLDSLLILNSLKDAYRILADARVEVANTSNVLWNKIYNAQKHVDAQIEELIAE